MKKEIIIHIGSGKTATTFLQDYFFPLIEKQGCFKNLGGYRYTRNQSIEEYYHSLSEIIKNDNTHTNFLISEEMILGYLMNSFDDFGTNVLLLKKYFPDAKILLVIRKQVDFLNSVYCQSIHQGYAVPLKKFLGYRKVKNRLIPNDYAVFPNFNYYKFSLSSMINVYATLFGLSNLLVLPYEMFRDEPDTFLVTISDFINPTIKLPEHLERNYLNDRFSTGSAKIAYWVNPFLKLPFNKLGFIPQRYYWNYDLSIKPKNYIRKLMRGILIRANLRHILNKTIDKLSKKKYQPIQGELHDFLFAYYRDENIKIDKQYHLNLKKYEYY